MPPRPEVTGLSFAQPGFNRDRSCHRVKEGWREKGDGGRKRMTKLLHAPESFNAHERAGTRHFGP